MASKEFSNAFKTALGDLKDSLKSGNFDGRFTEVRAFLDNVKAVEAEASTELVLKQCNDFLKSLQLKNLQGATTSEIEKIKQIVHTFKDQTSGKSENAQTSGTKGIANSKPGGLSKSVTNASTQGGKLNVQVPPATMGPHRTTVSHSPNKSDHQGPSPKAARKDAFVREEFENQNNGAASKQEAKGLEKGKTEMQHSDWKLKVDELVKTLEEKTRIITNFEQSGERLYLENMTLKLENEELLKDRDKWKQKNDDLQTELQTKTEEWNVSLEQFEEACKAIDQYKKKVTHLEDTIKSINRQNEERLQKLVAERDDLRNRYSKVAGQKLKDNNSDISDLSDPFRPMKLGEKFSELYDNEWTDAFSSLTDKIKKNEKDAIKFLLDTLEECYRFCKEVADSQFTQLRNVFLYHGQDLTKTVAPMDKPRLHSKQEYALLEVRKTIASTQPDPVIQQFIEKMKGKLEGKCPKEITAYYEKCTETCWLLAVHNPPLYMDMEMKPGTKLDINLYTPYYTPGDKTDFLVWPPLFNVKNGGLINKGVMAPVMEKRKKGK